MREQKADYRQTRKGSDKVLELETIKSDLTDMTANLKELGESL